MSRSKKISLSLFFLWLSACQNTPLKDFSPRYFNELALRHSEYSVQKKSAQDWGIVPLYKDVLGTLFFSHCSNLPSDSAYLQMLLSQRCVPKSYALLTTIGRLLREHDLNHIQTHNPLFHDGRLRWIDFPIQCGENL